AMKLRALIGVTLSSLALCSAAHASLVTADNSSALQAATPSVSSVAQAVLGRSQAATQRVAIVVPPNQVPEPESWMLAIGALGAMALVQRRKSRSK
ncbi:MAG TPA: PEP-CTERM sorting domain-containing protein, partial [Albitalea sp.]|nr:PEP-CTERM sorting domain-containing protein [Albitalea sp.]